MRKIFFFIAVALMTIVMSSCQRVAPNYAGVLMENFGKAGKSDFKIVSGRVNVAAVGTELFQVPLFDQRGEFAEPMTLKSADNTEFTVRPTYSYKVIKERAIDIVFDNKHIDKADTENGKDGFMQSLEDNILEPRIYDLTKEECRKYKADVLMADGGSLMFEKKLEEIIEKEFEKRGLKMLSFQAQLDYSQVVRERIDKRNEVNTNLSVIDQQIEEKRKQLELQQLETAIALEKAKGLTKEILYDKFIDKWDGKTPIYGAIPDLIKVNK